MWDQMYRSNRRSRGGIFMMAISVVDNTLWDVTIAPRLDLPVRYDERLAPNERPCPGFEENCQSA
jgi:hypothetical protein